MCDPLTAILGGASMVLGMASRPKASTPPPAAVPAAAAPVDKAPEPVVKVGAADNDAASTGAGKIRGYAPTRKGGNAIGGLGRSGMSLDL